MKQYYSQFIGGVNDSRMRDLSSVSLKDPQTDIWIKYSKSSLKNLDAWENKYRGLLDEIENNRIENEQLREQRREAVLEEAERRLLTPSPGGSQE